MIQGTLTCVVAFAFFFLIPSFPEDAKWLGEDERTYVKARLRKDQGRSAAERSIGVKDVVNVFKDFKVFVGGFMYFGLIVPAYGYVKIRVLSKLNLLTASVAMRSSHLASSKATGTLRSVHSFIVSLRGLALLFSPWWLRLPLITRNTAFSSL